MKFVFIIGSTNSFNPGVHVDYNTILKLDKSPKSPMSALNYLPASALITIICLLKA